MKTRFLFPHACKRYAWIGFAISSILIVVGLFTNYEFPFLRVDGLPEWMDKTQNFSDEIVSIMFIVSAILVGFSKEKNEDEFIAKIRLESLLWATYINYVLLILSILFVYGGGFLDCLCLNMFTLLAVFIIRFHIVLFIQYRR
jgi:hypothetical protein